MLIRYNELAWMIAAVLPLPPNPKLDLMEMADDARSNFRPGRINASQHMLIIDETRYESARWWRNVNRIMSVVGLLIIGAIVALVVVGVRQGWVVRVG